MSLDLGELFIPLVLEIEQKGAKPDHIHFDFSGEESEDFLLLKREFPKVSSDEIYSSIKAAISNDYFKRVYLGSEYVLAVTTKGFAAGKSKIMYQHELRNQSASKKFSDWVDMHNGLATLYAAIVGTLGLLIALFK